MRPNILFFLIDGLRADQCFGKDKTSYTPNIDSLIQKGTYFSNAFASVDGTIVSLNTIFSSNFQVGNAARSQKVTLIENNLIDTLKNNGYHIYGTLPNQDFYNSLLEHFENENKLDHIENCDLNGEYSIDPVAARFLGKKIKASHSEYEKHQATLPTGLAKRIIQFLESEEKQEPYFCYFHIFDIHPLREGKKPIGIEDFDNEKNGSSIYARTVSSIDFQLGKILELVDLENTILILTADHGERIPYDGIRGVDFQPKLDHAVDFGKKILPKSAHKTGGEFLYNIRKFVAKRKLNRSNKQLTNYQKRSRETFDNVSLFDEMLHVPLLFVNNNINPGIISNTVNHTDILPTLCGILNINLNHKVNGRNLLPLIQGNNIKENPIYLRTRPYIDSKLDKRDSVGIRTSNYKYFRSIHNPKDSVNLYDLKNDPYENNNIAETNKELVDKFEELLLEIQENDFSENNGENVEELTHDEIEYELKKMGYV